MTIGAFRPAIRENVGLFIGLAGESGCGKTWTAMELATGIVGEQGRFAVIDTENKRASHYADKFKFDVLDLAAPFSSERYTEAVETAVKAGYKAIVLDSATHEHTGIGGYLDAQSEELKRLVERVMKKNPNAKEWDVIEKMTPLSWQPVSRARKRMMERLLAASTSIPIVFCFRAEEKVFGTKDGKLVAYNPPVWQPVCGKGMPFEMTAFFLMHQDRPGVIAKVLKLQDQHKALFPMDRPLTRDAGRQIAQWAAGGAPAQPAPRQPDAAPIAAHAAPDEATEHITADQQIEIDDLITASGAPKGRVLELAGVKSLAMLPAADYADLKATLQARVEKRQRA